jgi:hypothetical protein
VLSSPDTVLSAGDSIVLNATALTAAGDTVRNRLFTWQVTGDTIATLDPGPPRILRSRGAGNIVVTVSVSTVSASMKVAFVRVGGDPGTPPAPSTPPGPSVPPSTPGKTKDGLADLPILPAFLDFSAVRFFDPAQGRVINVANGTSLQAALDSARPGDEIRLARGSTFSGSFHLRVLGQRAGNWVTIRTDLGSDSLYSGVRMTPADAQRLQLAKIVGTGRDPFTIDIEDGASGYRLVEVEITSEPSLAKLTDLVRFGRGSLKAMSEMPGELVLDRMWIHGTPVLNLIRCVGLNSASTAVINSTIEECHSKGFDSMALGGTSGSGPYKIVNNYLSGAGMGIFFGGGDPQIQNLIPSDIEIRRNYVTRPLAWRTVWTVKNLLEFKNAQRALVQANVFENNWVDGQPGSAINLKAVNQNGRAPWSTTSDVTFRFNIVRNSAGGITTAAHPESYPSVPTARIEIADNLLYNIGNFNGTVFGRMMQLLGPLNDIVVTRNTLLHMPGGASALLVDGTPSKHLEYTENVFTRATYGILRSGAGEGTPALEAAWPGGQYIYRDNAMIAFALPRALYPASAVATFVHTLTTTSTLPGTIDFAQVGPTLAALGATKGGVDLRVLADSLAGVGGDFGTAPAGAAASFRALRRR